MQRVLRGALAVVAAAVLSLAGLLGFLWVEHHVSLTLPAPSGPFAVSRFSEVWTDDRRPDPLPEAAGKRTELVVWFWYPTTRSQHQQPADYLPADWVRESVRRQTRLGKVVGALLTRGAVYPHSVIDGALSTEQPRYPVVILRPGLGALTIQQTTLAEDLASHGYVVVGFDAPYRTGLVVFPDGRVVTRPASLNPETLTGDAQRALATKLMDAWVSDTGFVLDRLTAVNASTSSRFGGRLDLRNVGIVGHSLGGATAAQFCHDDARCRAGVDIDGLVLGSVVRDGLRRPFMFLLSDHGGDASDPADRQIADDIRSVYDRLPADSRVGLLVRGSHHFSFSDDLITKTHLVRWGLRIAAGVTLDPRRGLAIATEAVRRFLDMHLKDAPSGSLQEMSKNYPELQFKRP